MKDKTYAVDVDTLDRVHDAARILALRALADPDAAAEVAQETVARLLEAVRAGRWRGETPLGAYARGITRHVITDVLRQRQRVLPFPEGRPEVRGTGPDPLDELVSGEQAERVRRALAELSESDRELLRMCFYQGFTPREVAARLREPSARVRKRKSRALERLREAFLGAASHERASAANTSTSELRVAESGRSG